ncbi:uncharacterized protein si:ch211-191i18.2 [Thalassophryne amazonica]|uniref:uncharacterized protein si:ch211-191i18.2 n=1 Tax=Thalassophryne amazonica TaxID=390379 RepID=UPI0014724823|nr:uncharacterized protein si:ch211-191i18.2 [Thalassophryne amazonica]
MFSFLCVCRIGASLILLLTAVSEAEFSDFYEDSTSTPDYDSDSDYKPTFDYGFYSNTSSDELEEFLKDKARFLDLDSSTDREQQEESVTMVTSYGPTEKGSDEMHNAAALPVSLESGVLMWILLLLSVQQI